MKRKLPKLHLRDLFWLVLVCACLCAWGKQYRRAEILVETLKIEADWKEAFKQIKPVTAKRGGLVAKDDR